MARSVLVLNGPNLNVLEECDPTVYGGTTLSDINQLCLDTATYLSLDVTLFQSNHEGEMIDKVHEIRHIAAAVVANCGGYSHTSLALMDALAILRQPVIEVHPSNVYARDTVRRTSYTAPAADVVIAGAGAHGYPLALQYVAALLNGEDH